MELLLCALVLCAWRIACWPNFAKLDLSISQACKIFLLLPTYPPLAAKPGSRSAAFAWQLACPSSKKTTTSGSNCRNIYKLCSVLETSVVEAGGLREEEMFVSSRCRHIHITALGFLMMMCLAPELPCLGSTHQKRHITCLI